MLTSFFNLKWKIFIHKPEILYYIILGISYLIYIMYTNTIFLNGENIYELDGRPVQVYELDGRPIQIYEERQYHAWNPGIVQTTEGYRVELENTEIPNQNNGPSRIPNPSHYPPQDYQYNNDNEYNNNSSNDVSNKHVRFEPTRSEMERDDIYFGTSLNTKLKKSTSKYSVIKDLKNRVINAARNAEKKYEDSVIKYIDEKLDREERYNRYFSPKTYIYCEKYIKGQGILTRAEMNKLVRDGYTVRHGRIKRIH